MTPKCPDCKRDQDDCICASPASAPKGWNLVPFEPTDAMIECGCRALGALYGQYGASEAYRAMLAAAPTPPSTEDRKAVGTAHITPGASGFTMCVFNATDVPVGTVLYTMQEDKSCAK